MSNKTCEGCVYKRLHNGLDGWGSSQPHPCSNCERNQIIFKDNYQPYEREIKNE